MIRKFKKHQIVDMYEIVKDLEGHIFALGRIGGGKSVSLLSIILGFMEILKYKYWDIYGGERHEGIYTTIPNQDHSFWEDLKKLGQLNESGPKQQYVNLLYPYFASKFPKKLPQKSPYVQSKAFTLPLKEVMAEYVRMVLGNMSEASKYTWNEINHVIKKKDTCAVLMDLSQRFKGSNTTLHKSFITPMHREKFLMSHNCDYNLDLVAEAKNKEAITVLCLDYVPPVYHLFIINYIIKKITELVDVNTIHKKNILFIREAATFFRATDDSILEDRFKIFRANLMDYIRMGRRGTYFALDCQSAHEVKSLVQGSEDFLLMFKTTAWRDKEEMCAELKRERRMRPDQIANLAFLEKGEAFIAETGKVVKKVKVSLPRTMYWKKEYPNFYKRLWENHGGGWMNTSVIKEHIDELYKDNLNDYKQKEKVISEPQKVKIVPELDIIKIKKPSLPKIPDKYN